MKALRSWGERDVTEESFLLCIAAISFCLAVITFAYTRFGIMGVGVLTMIAIAVCIIVVFIIYTILYAVDDDFDYDESFDGMVDMICKGFIGLSVTIFAIYQLTLHASKDELMVLGLMVGLYLLGSLKSWGVMWFYHRVNKLLAVND